MTRAALTAEPRFYACAAQNPCPDATTPAIDPEAALRCGSGLSCMRAVARPGERLLVYLTPRHAQQLQAQAAREGRALGALIDARAEALRAAPDWRATRTPDLALARLAGCPELEVVSPWGER